MSYIGFKPVQGNAVVDEFTSTGGSTYTLSSTPSNINSVEVVVGGLTQTSSVYSFSGNVLTLTGVASGTKIIVRQHGEKLLLQTPANNTVTSDKIVDGAIVNADINASAAIATSKLSGVVTSIVSHGLATSATTDTTNADNISSGTLPAGRYTDTVYTHPTTAGNKHIPTAGATDQVLTYSSSGTASWADPAGGGAWTFLASATASSSSEIVFDDFMDGTYDTYVLLAEGWLTSTDGAILYLLFSQDGGATYLTGTTYHHVATVHTSNGIHSDIHSESQPTLDIVRGIDSAGGGANGDGCFTAWFQNMGASTRPYVHGTYGHRDNTAGGISSGTFGGCIGGSNSTIESFKLKVSSGTISTGNFRFYGVSNS